jgi:polyisoprenoid-binding protein YceI
VSVSSRLRWIALFILAVVGASLAWVLYFAGGTGQPSTDLTTPEVESGDAPTFAIDPAQSTASFEINEILNGNPKRVIGTTDQVAGQVAVEPSDPSDPRFSTIVVNARTFRTDSSQRDRQIRGPVILNSATDEHEFISFEIGRVVGLDGPVTVGDSVEVTLLGDLTIKGTTRGVVFQATLTLVDSRTIRAVAESLVLRSDFGIGIPSVPSVAGVDDEVTLKLDLVLVSG